MAMKASYIIYILFILLPNVVTMAQSVESDELFSKGVHLYNMKKYKEAIPIFQESDRLDKIEMDSTHNRRDYSAMWLASCHYQLGDEKQAQKISPYYYKLSPIDRRLTIQSDSLSALADKAFEHQDYTKALKLYKQCDAIEATILGKKIWDNLLGDTPSKTNIYFSPEGIFHLLGIEYLCFDRPDCKIFRLSSTRRLCEDRGTASKPSLLLLGGLNYNDDSAVIQHPDTLPDRSASEILGRDMLPPVVGQGYTYLNGSLAEVNKIRTLISPNSCQLYQYSKGTEDIVKQDMQKYNMIHISTHGFCFDYQIVPSTLYLKDNVSEDLSLSRCGIILSGANRTAKQDANNKYVEDGILNYVTLI